MCSLNASSLSICRNIITELVIEYKPIVAEIESNPLPITKDNYDVYLSVLSGAKTAGKDTMMYLATIALIRVGASKEGVLAALGILHPRIKDTVKRVVEELDFTMKEPE